MKVRYLFSSPTGDISVDGRLLSRPFLIDPMREHPYLKLGDYFKAIEQFITGNSGDTLLRLLERVTRREHRSSDIAEVVIRSEKHGGLYHLSSVETLGPDLHAKFVVSTAVTESSQEWLQREFETLRFLNDSFRLPYLPEVYLLDSLELPTPGTPSKLVMMLGQWFEDYHEWHLHRGDSGEPHPVIWDFRKGYRRAGDREIFELYRQASLILTLYYNIKSTHQIYPWLHSAGDFIVRSENEETDLRLTTARGYEPLMIFLQEEELSALTALLYFFVNLTIRMRLDRWEGVGEVAWAGDSCVKPAVEGFFQALRSKEAQGLYELGRVSDLLRLLKTFRADELRRLAVPLLELYRREDREALTVVEGALQDHCRALFIVLQDLPGQ
jgi:hypothetical protein